VALADQDKRDLHEALRECYGFTDDHADLFAVVERIASARVAPYREALSLPPEGSS
jgi:hypothetical protein